MENNNFLNKITIEYIVITHDLSCDIVTNELGIKPSRFFNKGDKFTSKFSNRVGVKPYGLWAIQSSIVLSEDINISYHMKYFQELFENKIETILNLKNYYKFECVFSIGIETNDAGISFDLSNLELEFIAKISTRYTCRFISKETIF